MQSPVQLAEQIVKQFGDTDHDTAVFALEIARLILNHRERAAIDFTIESGRAASGAPDSTV